MNNFVKIYYNLKQEQNRALESMITGTKITGTKKCSVKFTWEFTQFFYFFNNSEYKSCYDRGYQNGLEGCQNSQGGDLHA